MNGIALRLLTGSAAALYLTAAVLSASGRKRFEKWIVPVWLAASSFNAAAVAVNWIRNGYAPFVSMYQVLVFLALCFGPASLYMTCAEKADLRVPCAGLAFLTAAGCTCMDSGSVWHFPPALQSPFFIPHVICYMISYTLAAAAFVSALRDLIRKEDTREPYVCARVLFPFMTSGLFLGAIWANQVWGAFWSWDVKECWSLFTWLSYACALHFRKSESLRRHAKWFLFCGMIGVIVTFFLIGRMNSSSPHSYAS